MENKSERPVIVTTVHRGVFFGYAKDTSGDTIHLRCKARLQSGIEERAIATLERFFPGIKEKIQKDHPTA